MRFYTGTQFPEAYRGRIFIAEHGSWNRESPLGYRITTVRVEGDRATDYEVFAEGWLTPSGPWGRPADVLVAPDGSLLVADDHAGAIYRITYDPAAPAAPAAPSEAPPGTGSSPPRGH
jgi:glucose/arabinose dehydrogenase